MHPSWYYDFFEKIFDRGSAYEVEADLLRKQLGGLNGVVVEVGAGTGNHAAAVLKRSVEELVLINCDRAAVELLKHRFYDDNRVSVQWGDGFRCDKGPWCTRILAMYSLVQQAKDITEVSKRIRSLVGQVYGGGAVAFEVIDAEVSKAEYPDGLVNRIYEGSDGFMDICSSYREGKVRISYSGVLNGKVCQYTVQLVAPELTWMKQILVESGVDIRKSQVLDSSDRRILLGGTVYR